MDTGSRDKTRHNQREPDRAGLIRTGQAPALHHRLYTAQGAPGAMSDRRRTEIDAGTP
jgi:hypothetical protein